MQLSVEKGDITKIRCDAIVNAANSSLMGGGGVDGAIHRAGGPAILEACREIVKECGELPAGKAVITEAGDLPARCIIHTVGPVWRGGKYNEPEILAECYRSSLQLAEKHGCQCVAFPNISTGVYGYPKELAAEVAIQTIKNYLMAHKNEHMQVTLVCFDEENYQITNKKLTDV